MNGPVVMFGPGQGIDDESPRIRLDLQDGSIYEFYIKNYPNHNFQVEIFSGHA